MDAERAHGRTVADEMSLQPLRGGGLDDCEGTATVHELVAANDAEACLRRAEEAEEASPSPPQPCVDASSDW